MRTILIAGLILGAVGAARASLSNLVSAWGHDFTVTPFQPMELMVATARDRKSGAAMVNLVRMPSGTVMALVPLDQLKDMPRIAPQDMMPPP